MDKEPLTTEYQQELDDLRRSFIELSERFKLANQKYNQAQQELLNYQDLEKNSKLELERCRNLYWRLETEFKERTTWALELDKKFQSLQARCLALENQLSSKSAL